MSNGWPQAYALRHVAEVDSTNAEARRLACAGVSGPLWILADRQTHGRGRRNKVWETARGNLAATLLLRPGREIAHCAQLSFVAALSVADTVSRYAPDADVRLKWPNDVLAANRKIAGILLESATDAGGAADWLAVGVGLNIASHPAQTEFPATALANLIGETPEPRDALVTLAAFWLRWHEVWSRRGFAPIRDAWLARASGLGMPIRTRLGGGETCGMFEGIDATGALLLRESAARLRTITAGEVFFG